MKAVVISIILFGLLLGGIYWNGTFVGQISGVLEEYGERLSEPCEDDLKSLEDYWESKRELLGLSVSGTYLDGMDRTIISMRAAYESGDSQEYLKQISIFRHTAKEMGNAERVALKNIL